MAGEIRQSQVSVSDLEGQLNYLEYVLTNTRKKIALLKKDSLKGKTEDLLKSIDAFQDAIDLYQDELANQTESE